MAPDTLQEAIIYFSVDSRELQERSFHLQDSSRHGRWYRRQADHVQSTDRE